MNIHVNRDLKNGHEIRYSLFPFPDEKRLTILIKKRIKIVLYII